MKLIFKNYCGQILFILLALAPGMASASEVGIYSWERIMKQFADSMTGPVAYSVSIIAIVTCGFVIAFMDLQGGAKRFVQAGLGMSIAFFAAQITSNFFHFQGAVI